MTSGRLGAAAPAWTAGIALATLSFGAGPTSAQVHSGIADRRRDLVPRPGGVVDRPVVKRAPSYSTGVFWFDADLGNYRLQAERVGYQSTESLPFQVTPSTPSMWSSGSRPTRSSSPP